MIIETFFETRLLFIITVFEIKSTINGISGALPDFCNSIHSEFKRCKSIMFPLTLSFPNIKACGRKKFQMIESEMNSKGILVGDLTFRTSILLDHHPRR